MKEPSALAPERYTRIPPEVIAYANDKLPDISIDAIVEKAIHRVINAPYSERRVMLASGAALARDLKSWVRCPYSFDPALWERLNSVLEPKRENPAKVLAGAMMLELGMHEESSDE